MAKALSLTLAEMESKLGYQVLDFDESVERFYSDYSPVDNSIYEKTKREFEVQLYGRKTHRHEKDEVKVNRS